MNQLNLEASESLLRHIDV